MINLAAKEGESLEGEVTVTLTQREVNLLKLCLGLVDQDYAGSGVLHFDIQSLRGKLSHESDGSR